MKQPLHTIIAEIQKQERKLSAEAPNFIDEAYRMTVYLQELLHNVKEDIIKEGFANKAFTDTTDPAEPTVTNIIIRWAISIITMD